MLEFAFSDARSRRRWVGVVCARSLLRVLRRWHSSGGAPLGDRRHRVGIVSRRVAARDRRDLRGGVALGIAAAARRGGLAEDTVIGVFFSGSMALGVVLFSLQRGYQQDLFGYLFGNVLAVSGTELAVLGGLGAAVLVALWVGFRSLLFTAFDEEWRARRPSGDRLDTPALLTAAVTVVIGVRWRVILVEACPDPAARPPLGGHYVAASLRFASRRNPRGGPALSYWIDWPGGAICCPCRLSSCRSGPPGQAP